MNIKITIEYTDEFECDILGMAGANNIDPTDQTHLELISHHIKQTLAACGFHHDSIDKLFNGEIL